MLDHHDPPVPDTCDVCAFVRNHPGEDQRLEHTMTQIATSILLEDLDAEGGGPLSLQQTAPSSIGYPGPQVAIEPRHYFWALVTEQRLGIVLREEDTP